MPKMTPVVTGIGLVLATIVAVGIAGTAGFALLTVFRFQHDSFVRVCVLGFVMSVLTIVGCGLRSAWLQFMLSDRYSLFGSTSASDDPKLKQTRKVGLYAFVAAAIFMAAILVAVKTGLVE